MNLFDTTSTNSVLIVDNNVHETQFLNNWFRHSGFQVEVVTNAIQAISRVRNTDYRLVLIDINLGDELGGFETIWLMKTLVNGAKIALISETITKEHERKALSHGVYHWIHKPFNKKTTPKEIEQVFLDSETDSKPARWNFLTEFTKHFAGQKNWR